MRTMIAITMTLLLLPVLSNAVDSTYYFYRATAQPSRGDTIHEIVEVYSDSAISAPSGFTEKTKSQINSMGFLIPEEVLTVTDPNDIDQGSGDGYTWSSWIYGTTLYGIKKVYGCSRTGRSWIPGYLYLKCKNECLWDNWPAVVFLPLYYPSDGVSWDRQWGYRTTHSFVRVYPAGYTARWKQTGWHKWSSGGTRYTTTVTKLY